MTSHRGSAQRSRPANVAAPLVDLYLDVKVVATPGVIPVTRTTRPLVSPIVVCPLTCVELTMVASDAA